MMAAVPVLQGLHGLSDREAAGEVAFDLCWKIACGYAVNPPGSRPMTLTYRRLAAGKRPERIFMAVSAVIAETGVSADSSVGARLLGKDTTFGSSASRCSRFGLRHRPDARRPPQCRHAAVIKPWPFVAAVPEGFTVNDFNMDEVAGPAACTPGVTPTVSPTAG